MTDISKGDLVVVKWDDGQDNQGIIGKEVRAVSAPGKEYPNWVDVTFEGQSYSVRASDCLRISRTVVGIDEVGRGALAGPLVVGAAAFRIDGFWNPDMPCPVPGVKDSKAYKSSSGSTAIEKREKAAQALLAFPGLRGAGAGLVTPEEINAHNMTWAMREAIARSLTVLKDQGIRPDLILLDGHEKVEGWPGEQRSIPKADALWWPVSAASVLAKVFRDRMMIQLHGSYPKYGFGKHMGYGTPQHIQALQQHGPTPIHRTTFIQSALEQ